jgi:tetratricopeptide (TPR) repeat protein
MTSNKHDQSFHLAAEHVDNGRRDEALAIFRKLLDSDLDDFGKSMACINIATIHDQLGQVAQALEAYDRGIAIERTFGPLQRGVAQGELLRRERAVRGCAGCVGPAGEKRHFRPGQGERLPERGHCVRKTGPDRQGLEWYERGIKYERPHHRFNVAEHKAWYLSTKGRTRESLMLYDRLALEASMTEADKDRIRNNISLLRP